MVQIVQSCVIMSLCRLDIGDLIVFSNKREQAMRLENRQRLREKTLPLQPYPGMDCIFWPEMKSVQRSIGLRDSWKLHL